MSIANLHETLLSYTLRKNQLNLSISNHQSRKMLAISAQADVRDLQAQDQHEIREFYKALYDNNEEYNGKYKDYTEIPDFEEEMDKIAAKYQDQLDELAASEAQEDAETTAESAEYQEATAWIESLKSMLSSNIQEDFNYSLN